MFRKKNKYGMNSYFVSIGAGLNQIPLIVSAKKLGFHVIGVDKNPCAPGFINCDLKIQESVENHPGIFEKLNELLIDGEINGIMTKSYGPAMKTTSFLAEKFNIPFLPFARSDDFINKNKMKSVFIEHNIKSPGIYNFKTIKNIEKKIKINFPIIKKPVVGHAKEGVSIINNIEELRKSVKSERKRDHYLYEDFIKGDEIIAIGFINKKKYHLIEITDKITTPFPYFVDLIHLSPSIHFHRHDAIKNIGQSVTDGFGVDTSPLIMEFIVNDNCLYLIEAVPEFGGEFLSDVLIPAGTGYNIIEEAIKSVTNRGFRTPLLKKNRKSVAVKYITGRNGLMLSFNPRGVEKTGGIIYTRIFKEIGSRTREPKTNLDRIGVIVAKGKTTADALKRAEEAEINYNIRYKEE